MDLQQLDDLRAQGPSPTGGPRPGGVVAVRRDGSLLSVSGQVAAGPDGALLATGRVGAEVDLALARRCAWQCAANVLGAVAAEVGDLSGVDRTVRVTVYVASEPGFTEQHLVADAATEFLLRALGERVGRHARAAIGVAALPTGSPVEVEATFRLRD